jgi:hypothetical protein
MSSTSDEGRPVAGSTEKGPFIDSAHSPDPPLQSNKLHFVSRGDPLPTYNRTTDDQIVGYDSSLMKDRALLSSAEEKKVLRKIDWHLLPLLAIMYMVKTIDAANVCQLSNSPADSSGCD